MAVVHGLLYALAVPPWQAPDEIAHFEYSRLLVKKRGPVSAEDADPNLEKEIIDSMIAHRALDYMGIPTPEPELRHLPEVPFYGRSRSLHHFSLSYVPYALVLSPFSESDVALQLFVLRVFSVLLAAVVVLLASRSAQVLFPKEPSVRLLIPSMVIFLPQHAFVSSTVNDGNLVVLLASYAVYCLIVFFERSKAVYLLASGGATAVAVASKPTALFLLPCVLGVATCWLWKSRSERTPRAWTMALFLPAVLAVGFGGLLYVRREFVVMLADQISRRLDGESVWLSHSVEVYRMFLSLAFRSFWAMFGWMRLPVAEGWYWLLGSLTIAGVVGYAKWRRREPSGSRSRAMSVLFAMVLASLGVPLGFAIMAPAGVEFAQGRYLFPAIIPITTILAVGWSQWVPDRYARHATIVFLTGVILFDGLCLYGYLMPFFYL